MSLQRLFALAVLWSSASGGDVSVYFGCGCFWRAQHAFVLFEMSLGRQGENITARTAYAGGNQTGPDGEVCYHNSDMIADYGLLGHAEAVTLTVPQENFSDAVATFWELCPRGEREDYYDVGAEYRSIVGLRGGLDSSLLTLLHDSSTSLVAGEGDNSDTLGMGKVFVYDTLLFPAHQAERYMQFHDDQIQKYGPAYNALKQYAPLTSCPADQSNSALV
eukprot:CAMPEP_0194504060 /NCGR_PEP_ID=MMETSP0253-20130528/28735_1 /TAXON_ID=2966 /ORGANISM="Noctiluca scintillans" /LENGTH=218 /DNA_ID=CAMNT_0039346411 /DNA_START=40 /DNA_END=696 /DNA_ORIENTATION=-